LSSIVKTYDPTDRYYKDVYGCIEDNLESWIERAIKDKRLANLK
jgi:hypothetical protein